MSRVACGCGCARAGVLALLLGASAAREAGGLEIRSVLSAWNAVRPLRHSTDYIVLHTTESPTRSSLNSLRANGEAHYMVAPDGVVYRIIDRHRVALHAGRSLWDGRSNLDDFSIGIEVVGYYDHDITPAQYTALRQLLDELQTIHHIPDDHVLTHSMVAYGTPNRWFKRSHRGRKRCGMLFGTAAVRHRLGLEAKPAFDPDVAAGRLIVGDPYLASVLYGRTDQVAVASAPPAVTTTEVVAAASPPGDVVGPGRSPWDIVRDRYRSGSVTYVFPNGKTVRGNQITNWGGVPVGTRVIDGGDRSENVHEGLQEVGRDGSVRELAGDEFATGTTLYFLPDGTVRKGCDVAPAWFQSMPKGTRVLVGYKVAGVVSKKRHAFDICGAQWSAAETFYRFPDGSVRSGDVVNQKAILTGTTIYVRD